MIRTRLAIALLLFSFSNSGLAETHKELDQRVSSAVDTFAECAAFYNLSAIGAGRAGSADLRDSQKSSASVALAVVLSAVGKDTASAKFEQMTQALRDKMENDYSHFSRLVAIYGQPCRRLVRAVFDASKIVR